MLVNTYTDGNQMSPDVAVDNTGNFVITWHGNGDGDDNGVYAQKFNSDGTKAGAEFNVNEYVKGGQGYPSIAMDDSGDYIIVWESYSDKGAIVIHARRYKSSGEKDGPGRDRLSDIQKRDRSEGRGILYSELKEKCREMIDIIDKVES